MSDSLPTCTLCGSLMWRHPDHPELPYCLNRECENAAKQSILELIENSGADVWPFTAPTSQEFAAQYESAKARWAVAGPLLEFITGDKQLSKRVIALARRLIQGGYR